MSLFTNRIQSHVALMNTLLADTTLLATVEAVAAAWVGAYQQDKKILFGGNGGSAADAQHLAAELSGRFYLERKPLYAEALHVNGSYLTAVGNDYGYDESYARMVRAAGRPGDILMALSTSGNSPNILRAADTARECGMLVIGMTGAGGGKLAARCDHLIAVPSEDTPRIQEAHMLLGHCLCEYTEAALFGHAEL